LVGTAKKQNKHAKYDDDVKNFSVKGNSKIDNGLVQNRGVTDCLCLIIFLGFFGALGFVTFQSFSKGKINEIVAPVDHELRLCGIDEDVKDYSLLYLYNLEATGVNEYLNQGLCVSKCPTD